MANQPNERPLTPEEWFLTLLPRIERIGRHIAWRRGLRAADVEDFVQHVKMKLIEDDYAVLCQFERRSKIDTYLSIVVSNAGIDWQISAHGKWRPTADARRLGDVAVLLERLIVRDGHSVDEAWEIISTNHRLSVSRAELEQLAAQLPRRYVRRFVSADELEHRPSEDASPDAMLEQERRDTEYERALEVLRTLRDRLPPDDQLILVLRFEDGLTIREIAQTLGLSKSLYRRIEALRKQLRTALEAEGIGLGVLESLDDNR